MNAIRKTLVLSILLMTVSAYAQDVSYNFAAGTDFSQYKTYNWVQVKEAQQLDQITDQQLRDAFDAELAKKGFTKTDRDPALLVAYQASVDQEKEVTMYNSGWGYGAGWGGSGISTAETSTISVGQVDFDVYDAAQQKLIWRGTASKTLDVKAKPDKRQENIAKGVTKLLKNFPPPVKKP